MTPSKHKSDTGEGEAIYTALPSYIEDVHNHRADCGEIWITYPIDDRTIELVFMRLLSQIQSERFSKIIIYINSQGGNVSEGLAVANLMRVSPIPVWTVALGEVSSMAVGIFAAGERRFAFEDAVFMCHDVSGNPGVVKKEEHRTFITEMERRTDQYLNLIASGSKKPVDWWKKQIQGKDYFFGAKEAKQIGIATDIVNTKAQMNRLLKLNIIPVEETV